MPDFKEQLLNILSEIKGSGSFVSNDTKSFVFPGLNIMGVGEIGFPVNTAQVKEMIKVAHKAPFGKGSKTILDAKVRSAWEIDNNNIAFGNKDWGRFIDSIIKQIKPDLGIEGHSVTANLYKLLIYEKGDFFVAHKDSKKEKGMFGTLIIGLPSAHAGGELIVKFDGRTEVIDFSEPASQYKIPFAAFYADCEHEIKPITSGYRVCLVYNLVQNKGKEKIVLNPLTDYAERLAAVLRTCTEDQDIPKIVLLGHQYTPANFTMEALKLNDRPKAEALIQAAQKAGFYFKLGLVTSYQIGELETDGVRSSRNRSSYYDDFDDDDLQENGTMGEVYDDHIEIEHWMEEGVPPLRNITFEENDLISAITLNEGEPIEKEAEGYTGNAGMEMSYWYHYGAVFLWPEKYHFDMLINLEPSNKFEWIDYYNKHWSSLDAAHIKMTKQLAESVLLSGDWGSKTDFSPLVNWLINLDSPKYLSEKGTEFLQNYFTLITVEDWMKLFEKYPSGYFERIFTTVASTGNASIIRHILAILDSLLVNTTHIYNAFVHDQVAQMPTYINAIRLSKKEEQAKAKDILRYMLVLGKMQDQNSEWLKLATAAFTRELTREYVNDVLVKVILETEKKTLLAKQILAVCKKDLKHRVEDKPQPPANWSRSVPNDAGNKKVWAILSDFLQSPSQQIFDYQKLQGLRTEMENIIRHTSIDIKMETIRKGSPHTLRLIKTQDAYERDMAKWKIDVGLLEKAEKW